MARTFTSIIAKSKSFGRGNAGALKKLNLNADLTKELRILVKSQGGSNRTADFIIRTVEGKSSATTLARTRRLTTAIQQTRHGNFNINRRIAKSANAEFKSKVKLSFPTTGKGFDRTTPTLTGSGKDLRKAKKELKKIGIKVDRKGKITKMSRQKATLVKLNELLPSDFSFNDEFSQQLFSDTARESLIAYNERNPSRGTIQSNSDWTKKREQLNGKSLKDIYKEIKLGEA